VLPVSSHPLYQRLLQISEGFLDSVTIVDFTRPGRLCTFVNQRFVAETGYAEEDSVGRNLSFLQGESTCPSTVEHMRKAFSSNQACCVDIVNYRRDGSPFLNRLVMLPILFGDEAYYLGFQNMLPVAEPIRAEHNRIIDIDGREIAHIMNNYLARLMLKTDRAVARGSDFDLVLEASRREFEMINHYCVNIENEDSTLIHNPFREEVND